MLESFISTTVIIALFLGMAVSLIYLVINLFGGAEKSLKEEYEDAKLKGKLYSKLKIVLVTKELDNKQEVYHLNGLVDNIEYDIKILKSEYENKIRYYKNSIKNK